MNQSGHRHRVTQAALSWTLYLFGYGEDVIMTAADPYKVKHVEPVLKSSHVLARIFTLAPGDTIPWHYHQYCADHFFVLEGVLSISTREPALTRKLAVGQAIRSCPEQRI